MLRRVIPGFLVLTVAAADVRAQQQLPADSLARMRRYSEWFLSGQVDSVWAHVNASGRTVIPSRDWLAERQAMFSQLAGAPVTLLEERFVWRGASRQYWRTMRAPGSEEPVLIRWVIGNDGEIQGMGMNPQSATPPADSGGPVIRAGGRGAGPAAPRAPRLPRPRPSGR